MVANNVDATAAGFGSMRGPLRRPGIYIGKTAGPLTLPTAMAGDLNRHIHGTNRFSTWLQQKPEGTS
jgi:hypothetical protein